MSIIIRQKFVLKYNLNISETLVFSTLQTLGNVLSIKELINYIEIQKETDTRKAVVSLLDKKLIVFVVIDEVQYLTIKK